MKMDATTWQEMYPGITGQQIQAVHDITQSISSMSGDRNHTCPELDIEIIEVDHHRSGQYSEAFNQSRCVLFDVRIGGCVVHRFAEYSDNSSVSQFDMADGQEEIFLSDYEDEEEDEEDEE